MYVERRAVGLDFGRDFFESFSGVDGDSQNFSVRYGRIVERGIQLDQLIRAIRSPIASIKDQYDIFSAAII